MTDINDPKAVALAQDAEATLTLAKEYVIDGPEMYQLAADELKTIKGKAKELDELRKSMTRPLDDAKKRIMEFFNKPLQFLTDAEGLIKRSMLTYDREQERIRKEEEERLRALARAEQERLEEEARARAEQMKAEGKAEEAIMEMEAVPVIPLPSVQVEQPKVAGISRRQNWKARVVDPMQVPRQFLMVDEKALNAYAKATKGAVPVAGVEFYPEDIIAAGAR